MWSRMKTLDAWIIYPRLYLRVELVFQEFRQQFGRSCKGCEPRGDQIRAHFSQGIRAGCGGCSSCVFTFVAEFADCAARPGQHFTDDSDGRAGNGDAQAPAGTAPRRGSEACEYYSKVRRAIVGGAAETFTQDFGLQRNHAGAYSGVCAAEWGSSCHCVETFQREK